MARSRYFENFDVVELQQTFYQPPRSGLAEKWRREAPAGFEYAMKAWQLITHEPSSPTYRKLKMAIPTSKENHYGSFRPTDEVFEAWQRTRLSARILAAKVLGAFDLLPWAIIRLQGLRRKVPFRAPFIGLSHGR